MKLSEEDRVVIESLELDLSLKPTFDLIKSCLIWEDERPYGISSDGYELICDLWIIRSFFHLNLPKEKWGLDPDYFYNRWNEIKELNLKWPGFERFTLTEADEAFLESKIMELTDYRQYD